MCKVHASIKINRVPSGRLLLTSLDSFRKYGKDGYPSSVSKLSTCAFIIVCLTLIEHTLRQLLSSFQKSHPLLEDEMNRINVAKQIGVNAVSLGTISYLGFKARYILKDIADAVFRKEATMATTYDKRLFKYYPESAQIAVFFLGYQIKNAYDSIIWNDGVLLIGHHILAFFVAFGVVFPGSAHFYVPFYLGFSEASSFALSVLVNFDDEHGVKGLGDEFPLLKAGIGALFAVLFIICRVFIWSTVSYFYCRDVWNVLKTNDRRLIGRTWFFKFTFVALGLLSILQAIWLVEIFRVGKEILENANIL